MCVTSIDFGFSFNDETNGEVTLTVKKGVREPLAFKEADPVLLEGKLPIFEDDEDFVDTVFFCSKFYHSHW